MIVKSEKSDSANNQQPVSIRAEIAPGKFTTLELPREALGQYGLVKTVLLADGQLKAVWKTWTATIRITRDLPRRIGLDVDFATLHILVRAGLVEGSKISPFTTIINIDSLMQHVANASGDGARAYWTAERRTA